MNMTEGDADPPVHSLIRARLEAAGLLRPLLRASDASGRGSGGDSGESTPPAGDGLNARTTSHDGEDIAW